MTSAMDEVVARAEAKLEVLERMDRELRSLSITRASRCGRVTATVNYRCELSALHLSPAVSDPRCLGELICETAGRASDDLIQRHADVVKGFAEELDIFSDVDVAQR